METEKTESPPSDPNKLTFREKLTIAVLCLTNMINFMDRYCIAGVLVDVQEYFKIEDDQAGLIHTGFVVGYVIVSPLFGFLGDRYSRKYLMLLCLAVWTIMGFTNTVVDNIYLFILTRVFIGSSEAGFTVLAPSMLSDIVTGGKRILVFAIFYFASPTGTGLGFIVTPKINQYLDGKWWWGLRPIPLSTLIWLILLIFGVDPKRGVKDAAALGGKPAQPTSYLEDLRYILTNRSFLLIAAAFTFVSFVTAAFGWWGPKSLSHGIMLIEGEHGTDDGVIIARLGIISMFTGILGVAIGSGLSRILRPKYPFIDPIICGVGLLIALPFYILSTYMTPINMVLTMVFITFAQIALNFNWAVVMDMLMYVVVPMRRASAKGLETFISMGVGNSIGGVLVGTISEAFQSNYDFRDWHTQTTYNDSTVNYEKVAHEFYSLQYTLFIVMIGFAIGGLLFFWTAVHIVRDKEKAAEDSIEK